MKLRTLTLASLLLLAVAVSAFAATPSAPKGAASIQILKPADHADLDSDEAWALLDIP